MGTAQQHWRLAIAGFGHRGQFFQERWRLLNPNRVVALADDDADQRQSIGSPTIPVVPLAELTSLPGDCQAVLVTVPVAERGMLIADCLTARLAVLVEPPIASSLAEARALLTLAESCGVVLRVLGLRRSDPDFVAASTAIGTGRLGTLQALRWYTSEYAVWAGAAAAEYRRGETLAVAAPSIFDQLAGLISAVPRTVWGRVFPQEDGFSAEVTFDDDSLARIELRRVAHIGLRTGWMIEGHTGAYHQRRLITATADGELVDEPVTVSVTPPDPLTDLETFGPFTPMTAAEQQRCLVTAGLLEAVQRSIASGLPVAWNTL